MLQGADVEEGAFIDTLDVMDHQFLQIGAGAVVGEGTTIVAHTFKDGHILFNQASCVHSNSVFCTSYFR